MLPNIIEHKFKIATWPVIVEIKKKKTVDKILNPTANPSKLSIKLKAFVIVVIQKTVKRIFSQKSSFDSVW